MAVIIQKIVKNISRSAAGSPHAQVSLDFIGFWRSQDRTDRTVQFGYLYIYEPCNSIVLVIEFFTLKLINNVLNACFVSLTYVESGIATSSYI
jgi:hypothetical protein